MLLARLTPIVAGTTHTHNLANKMGFLKGCTWTLIARMPMQPSRVFDLTTHLFKILMIIGKLRPYFYSSSSPPPSRKKKNYFRMQMKMYLKASMRAERARNFRFL